MSRLAVRRARDDEAATCCRAIGAPAQERLAGMMVIDRAFVALADAA